jgi:hypothetical protein
MPHDTSLELLQNTPHNGSTAVGKAALRTLLLLQLRGCGVRGEAQRCDTERNLFSCKCGWTMADAKLYLSKWDTTLHILTNAAHMLLRVNICAHVTACHPPQHPPLPVLLLGCCLARIHQLE